MAPLTLKQVKKIPPSKLLSLINKAKKYVKKTDVWKEICEKYDESVDIIDFIPTTFGSLDVSAKTDHGVVILNYKILCDDDFFKDYSYLAHEYCHWFQQCYSDKPTISKEDEEYLDNKDEQEGFQYQIQYIADEFGQEEAEDYVDNLLDHHEIHDKKEVSDKKDILMSRIE